MSTSPQKITLYLSPGACSIAPHILLREVNASFEIVRLSIESGFSADFAKLNSKMRVPVLVLKREGNTEVITEVPAILTCIAQMGPERTLLGRSDLEIVRTYEWMNWLSGWLHAVGFGEMLRPQRFVEDEADFPKVRAKGRKNVEEAFEMIEGKLQGEYSVGERLSVVDVYLYVFWRWGSQIGVDMQGRFPKFASLVGGLVEREAVRKTLKEEGVDAFVGKAKI